jgi:hypothetical protein
MLKRLQRKTLIPTQIAGYAATLLVGVTIVMLSVQLYADIRPVLTQQTDVFRNHAVTLNKTVSTLNSLNKEGIYFTDDELAAIQSQPFVKNVARFSSSSFQAYAAIALGEQAIRTDLFFESIPDQYIDVRSDQWHWDSTADFIPIIIPEDYLNLYNFGFAESQALPVISQGAIEQVVFTLRLTGHGRQQPFQGHIVGFSGKINTILVPEAFLLWANREFGNADGGNTSRLLVEFSDASDERIPSFIETNGYNIKQDELENSKMVFFFHMALLFVITVALIIIVLSVAFIIMSLNVIVQKNRDLFVNLYGIGYSPRQIARYYQRIVGLITVADIAVAVGLSLFLRHLYVNRLASLFSIEGSIVPLVATAVLLTTLLVVAYSLIILRTIRKTVEPSAPRRLP